MHTKECTGKRTETSSVPSFEELFDISKIQAIQDAFAGSTGVGSIITDTAGNPITRPSNFCRLCKDIIRKTETGLSNCMKSDAVIGQLSLDGPKIQQCLSGGLWDAGASINIDGKHIANWMIGQVRNNKTEKKKIMAYAERIGADQEEFKKALEEVTIMPLEQFEQISRYLFLIANQLSELAYQKSELKQIVSKQKQTEEQLTVYKNHLEKRTAELKKANQRLKKEIEHATRMEKKLKQSVESMKTEFEKRKTLEKERREMESRLRQSQKMEAIGTLAGGIAHDFNNILFPIIGYAQMMDQELPYGSSMKSQVKGILSGGFRAKELVQQILTFSRRTEKEYQPLRVQLIIKELLKLSRSILPSSIKISKVIPNDVGMILADPTQVHQIVMNLITNALHAMEENGGELTVKLNEADFEKDTVPSPDMAPGPYICLEVTDTGTGMDEITEKRIFEPYFTTKPNGKGTGMGLAVVHGIVKDYHGKIIVRTRPGKGTSFFIYLPCISNLEIKTDQCTEPGGQLNGNERILVIDDEIPITIMLEKILSHFGYRVSSYNNSIKALEVFRNDPEQYDMVITDMTMPNISGEKLIMELKKIQPDIPVILCTGFSKKTADGRLINFKPDKVLMKPVLTNDLLSAIRKIFDRKPDMAMEYIQYHAS